VAVKKPAKLADVARAAGVSQGTASNAFNRPELVRLEVRTRVADAARELVYSGPDPKGKLLRAGKVNAIGVVVHERLGVFLDDPNDVMLLAGIAQVCDEMGAGMALISAYPEDETPAWSIKSALVDGFIIFCLESGDRLIEETRKRNLPFVAVDIDAEAGVSTVAADDYGGARMAAEHLAALGHRRFAALSLELSGDGHFGPVSAARRRAARYSTSRARLAGWSDAFAAVGVEMDSVPIMEVLNDRASARQATTELIAANPDVTAILAMSDVMALGGLDCAHAMGIAVPDRLSIVGFDDIPQASATVPPLTTVRQPTRAKGRLAAEMMFERGPPRREVLPVELVVRESTAPPFR
jgi:DNA-binding LacI/PurR family transcriptional regulator